MLLNGYFNVLILNYLFDVSNIYAINMFKITLMLEGYLHYCMQ